MNSEDAKTGRWLIRLLGLGLILSTLNFQPSAASAATIYYTLTLTNGDRIVSASQFFAGNSNLLNASVAPSAGGTQTNISTAAVTNLSSYQWPGSAITNAVAEATHAGSADNATSVSTNSLTGTNALNYGMLVGTPPSGQTNDTSKLNANGGAGTNLTFYGDANRTNWTFTDAAGWHNTNSGGNGTLTTIAQGVATIASNSVVTITLNGANGTVTATTFSGNATTASSVTISGVTTPGAIVTNGNSWVLTQSNRFNIETNIGALYAGTNSIANTNTVQVDALGLNKALEISTNGNVITAGTLKVQGTAISSGGVITPVGGATFGCAGASSILFQISNQTKWSIFTDDGSLLPGNNGHFNLGTSAAQNRIGSIYGGALDVTNTVTCSTLTATNGILLSQLALVPTNSIPASAVASGITNFLQVNMTNTYNGGGWMLLWSNNVSGGIFSRKATMTDTQL